MIHIIIPAVAGTRIALLTMCVMLGNMMMMVIVLVMRMRSARWFHMTPTHSSWSSAPSTSFSSISHDTKLLSNGDNVVYVLSC